MPDSFQAEPPRWSSERPSAYEAYSEVNLRKPEKQTAWVRRVTISVAAALVSGVLMAAVVLGVVLFSGKRPTPVTVAASLGGSVSAPPPAVVLPGDAEVAAFRGTWIATAVTIDGDKATDDEVAKVKLTMDLTGFTLVLPTTHKQGPTWTIRTELTTKLRATNLKKIDFLANDGSTLEAIYEINGDTLKLCLSQDDGPRPTDFAAKKDSKRILLILKRQEP